MWPHWIWQRSRTQASTQCQTWRAEKNLLSHEIPLKTSLCTSQLDSIFINCFFMGVKGLRLLLIALQSTSLPHPVPCLSSLARFWCRAPRPLGFVGHTQFFWSGMKGIVYSPWIFFLDIFLWIKAGLSVRFLNGTHFCSVEEASGD